MAKNESSISKKRLELPFFEGVNTLVASHILKKQDLSHAENARSDTIGSIEKRSGTERLGDALTASANYGIFFFENTTTTNTGFYRISAVGASLSPSISPSISPSFSPSLSPSVSPSSSPSTSLSPSISQSLSPSISASLSPSISPSVSPSDTADVYYLHTSGAWTILAGGGTGISVNSGEFFSTTNAESCLFYVNGKDNNMQINANGTTVVESTSSSGHLYNSPKARKINYFKDRLYLGDYTNTTRYKNGIMMSSMPLGILCLVDGDFAAADCGADDWITVTETKYIRATDAIDIYRGNVKIADVTIKAKTENSFQINAITFASGTTLESSDEIWVDGTYTGTKLFRWADNPSSGVNVKKYDTFKLSGGENDRIRMMANIGDMMVIANSKNIASWNGYNLYNADLGIGCVSDNGYVKALGTLWFVGYNGIYQLNGESIMPKLMSAKVEKYINGATKAGLEASAAGVKGFSVFFAIGTVTLYNPDGSTLKTLSNVCLEYNMRQENWYIHTNIKATQFATYLSTLDPNKLEYSSTESKYEIMELLSGDQLDDNSTAAIEIPFRIDTGNITLSKAFEKICYPHQIIIEAERGSGIQCFISLDNEEFYQIEGDAEKGCTILKVTNKNQEMNKPPRCRIIRLSIRDNTKKLCKITRVAIVYADTLEEENLKPEAYNV